MKGLILTHKPYQQKFIDHGFSVVEAVLREDEAAEETVILFDNIRSNYP